MRDIQANHSLPRFLVKAGKDVIEVTSALTFPSYPDYGNEKECGEGVARAIKEGIVKREELFIVSKLWQTFHDEDKVEPITRKQLADWQIDYFDLFLIHFPAALEYVDPKVRYPPGWFYDGESEVRWSKTTLQQTWGAMEKLVEKKLARSIGISNYQAQSVYDALIYAKIRPATLQIEHHPYLQQPDLVNLAQKEGIVVTAYSSFGPTGFMELDMPRAKSAAPLMEHDLIKEIAAKHKKTPAQVLLRWATQRGLAVIPKTSRPEVLAQNLDSTNFDLESSDLEKIAEMDLNIRFNKPTNVSYTSPSVVLNRTMLTFRCSTSLPTSCSSLVKLSGSQINKLIKSVLFASKFPLSVLSRGPFFFSNLVKKSWVVSML